MTSRPSKPPYPLSIAVSSFITPLLTLILGIIFAKYHSGHLNHITEPIYAVLPECPPSTICPFFYRRSKLPSGKLATRLFDVPRRNLYSNYSSLSSVAPNTHLVHQWHHPRVMVFDGGFEPLVKLLLFKAEGKFMTTTAVDDHGLEVVDDNRKSETAFVSPHREDQYLNELTDTLVRLIGLPNRHYSEVIEINRYNETGFFAIHHDFLSEAGMLDKSPFHGCQRVATAVLQLADVEGGETVFIKDSNFKGGFDAIDPKSEDVLIVPSKRGSLLAWFNLHPDTEEIDLATWHGSMPVTKGQKIAATFYLRNCSQADNSRRRAQFEDFLKEAPAPSAIVNERKKKTIPEEYLKDLNGEDDDDDDDESQYFDPIEDAEYMKEIRRYRTIRDAGGNTTEALIAAGFRQEDFLDLDSDVIIMGAYEERMEEDDEFEMLKKYKRIKEEGGEDVVDKLKKAGFEEVDFDAFDKEIEIFADRIGEASIEKSGADPLDDDIHSEEIHHLEAEREVGMDEETMRSFKEQLREQGLAEDDDEGSDLQDGDDVREEGELRMDEESIRAFEQRLRDKQLQREDEDQNAYDHEEDFEDVFEDVFEDFFEDVFEDDQEGQCEGDDSGDYVDDDFEFDDGDYEQAEEWDDEDEEWAMMEDEGEGSKVIPPGSRAQEVEAR